MTSYVGLLGRSPREGYWLLYLTLDMSRHVEIREDDIVHSEQLPPERSPFGSLGGTRVFVKKGAQVTSTQTVSRSHNAGEDDFDLDVQFGGASVVTPKLPCEGTAGGTTCAAECGGQGTGDAQTCLTCVSCQGTCVGTCHSCHTDLRRNLRHLRDLQDLQDAVQPGHLPHMQDAVWNLRDLSDLPDPVRNLPDAM